MGVIRRSQPVVHDLYDGPPVSSGHFITVVFRVYVEFLAPELDELSGRTGDQGLSGQCGREFAISDGRLAGTFQLGEPLITCCKIARMLGRIGSGTHVTLRVATPSRAVTSVVQTIRLVSLFPCAAWMFRQKRLRRSVDSTLSP